MSRKAFGNKENKNKENCRDDKKTKLLKKAKGSSIPQNMCFQWLQVSSDEHENLKHPDRGAKWTLEDKLKEHQTYGVNINSKVCVLYIQIINIYYKKYAQSLQKHQITPEKRQALLLWMGRTLSVTKMCSYQTYFLVMSYFDNFLELSERPFCNSQVHAIGLVCIGLASKITDINALQFDQIEMMGRIANQLYKELQVQFIQTLENNLIIPTYFEQFDLIGRILYFKYIDKAAKFTVIYYKGLRLLLFVTQYYEVTHYPLASVAYYCHEVTLKGLEKEYDVSDMLEELQFIRFKYQITQPVDMMIEINTLITKGLSDEQEKQLHAIYFAY